MHFLGVYLLRTLWKSKLLFYRLKSQIVIFTCKSCCTMNCNIKWAQHQIVLSYTWNETGKCTYNTEISHVAISRPVASRPIIVLMDLSVTWNEWRTFLRPFYRSTLEFRTSITSNRSNTKAQTELLVNRTRPGHWLKLAPLYCNSFSSSVACCPNTAWLLFQIGSTVKRGYNTSCSPGVHVMSSRIGA